MSRLAFRPASLLALIATSMACAPVAPQVPPDATPSAESASGAPTAPEDAANASQGGGTSPPEATQPAEAHADNGSGANSGVIALAAEGSNATAADVAAAVAVELPLIVAPGSCVDGASIPDRGENFVAELLAQYPDKFADIVASAEERRAQIRVGEVGTNPDGSGCIRYYSWREEAEYFYPASAIKTVGAVAALRTLEPFANDGWTVDTSLRIGQRTIATQEGNAVEIGAGRSATLRSFLAATLIESSNPGFNALYDIAGMEACNQQMWAAGFDQIRLFNRLQMGGTDPDAHRFVPSVDARIDGEWVTLLDARETPVDNTPPDNTGARLDIGEVYIDDNTLARVEEPLSCARKNWISLRDLQGIILNLIHPDLDGPERDLGLIDEHRQLLVDIMTGPLSDAGGTSAADRESRFKPLLPGVLLVIPDRAQLQYTNKAGRAYGFHLDSAYIRNLQNGRSFYVAVTIHVDYDGVMNDGAYRHDAVSFPFLQDVGEVLARALLVGE